MVPRAKQLQTVIHLASAESGCKRVVVNKCSGKRSRDDVERMATIAGGGVNVDTKVAKCDIKVAVGVKVGERECMVLRERGRRRANWNGFFDVNFFHCCR